MPNEQSYSEHRQTLDRFLEVLERSQAALEELATAERRSRQELGERKSQAAVVASSPPRHGIAPSRGPAAELDEVVPAAKFWNSIEYRGNQQRFLVCRLGSSGSAYLAKLLGAHPEVSCSHEGILANRPYSAVRHSEQEQQAFLAYVCSDSLHHAYQASGDVGSAWLGYLLLAPKHCTAKNHGPLLRTAVLHRHPLRVLKTQQYIAAHDRVTLPPSAAAEVAAYFARMSIDCDLEAIDDPDDRNFVWTCCQWRRAALEGIGLDLQIRVEDLNDLEYTLERLWSLTGVEYGADLVAPLIGRVVNSRTGEVESVESIHANFSPACQGWYRAIVAEAASAVGYSVDSENSVQAR